VSAAALISLQVSGLGKCYGVYARPQQRLRRLLTGAAAPQQHWSLKDVSFTLHKGQCLGVIGDNGAGKSTLLKLLAGSLQPSKGQVLRAGRLTAILELGAGFHPEFTGRDNLQFAGGFMGFSAAEMQWLTPSILEFAELGQAIDRPLKTYSSGMVVRLAFALVTAVQPEVLIIDEALAVGDQHFQKKCVERIDRFRQNGCTILFCSHSLYHVRQLCDQVLWLDKGHVRGMGRTEDIITAYETHVRLQDASERPEEPVAPLDAKTDKSVAGATPQEPAFAVTDGQRAVHAAIVQARMEGLTVPAQGGRPCLQTPDVQLSLRVVTPDREPPSLGFMLEQFKGVGIMSLATHAEGVAPTAVSHQPGRSEWLMHLHLPDFPLHSGTYVWSFYLFDAQGLVVCDEWKNHIVFDWISPSLTPGLVRLPHVWG
jgi:lipopolysaccharide transport system ATP-binding protein